MVDDRRLRPRGIRRPCEASLVLRPTQPIHKPAARQGQPVLNWQPPSTLLRRGRAADPPHKGPSLGLRSRLSVGFMFYRISTGRRCAAVGDNSLFRVFNSLRSRHKFPACAARELARKGLIYCTVFAGFVEKIDGIPGSQGKTGNLSPRGGTGRGRGAALLAGDRLGGTGPEVEMVL